MNFELKKFRIDCEVLHWKQRTYLISDIAHIFYSRLNIQKRTNFVKTGSATKVWLDISLDNGEKIELAITDNPIFLGLIGDHFDEVMKLNEIYAYLAKATFKKRSSNYHLQIQKKGCFDYGGCVFYPPDKIVCGDKEFKLAETDLLRGAGYVELRKKEYGLLDKMKREIPFIKIPRFDTQTDHDVIFALLHVHFGLHWE